MHVGLATGFAHQRGDAYPDAQFLREELENLVLAEELGFDSVWITEHHFTDYSMSNDPLQLLTYLAGRTRRVKLGTQVIIVPWRDPVRLAEAIVNLDHVSNGRAILGFGGGLSPDEFAGLRIDQNKSRALYNDILDMVIPAIETGILEGETETIRQPRVELRPRPLKSFEGRKFCGSLSGSSMYCGGEARLRQHGADAAAARQGSAAGQVRRGVAGSARPRHAARRRRWSAATSTSTRAPSTPRSRAASTSPTRCARRSRTTASTSPAPSPRSRATSSTRT